MLKGSKIFIALLLSLALLSCNNEIEDPNAEQFKKDRALMDKYIADNNWDGVYLLKDIYKDNVQPPSGTQFPKPDEGLRMGYITSLLDGTVIDSGITIYQHYQKFYPNGWEDAIGTMKEGEESRYLFASYLIYGKQTKQIGNVTVPANSVLRVDAKLFDIIPTENIPDSYAFYNGLSGTKTNSGLFYAVTTQGSGDLIKPGQTVTVKYKGYLLNGYVFDESNSYTFVAGAANHIAGWREAIPLLKKGDKSTLVIPSTLAYGPSGSFNSKGQLVIPPNAVIAFDMEILEVK